MNPAAGITTDSRLTAADYISGALNLTCTILLVEACVTLLASSGCTVPRILRRRKRPSASA